MRPALLALLTLLAIAAPAQAAQYSAEQTMPVPPASSFVASSGGDGWDLSLSATKVYNVFHHNSIMTVACRVQSTAAACWSPKTVRDELSRNFYTSNHSGSTINEAAGKLYAYGVRSDNTAGVVCFDTAKADLNQNPFCGFTALAPVGQSPYNTITLGIPMRVGNRWFAFHMVSGQLPGGATGTASYNRLLCFDVSTGAACAGQPFAVNLGTGTVSSGWNTGSAAIDGKIILPVNMSTGSRIACFDTATNANCAGTWPTANTTIGQNGAPFPMLTANGAVTGFCIPTSANPCWTMAGATTPTPAGMAVAVGATTGGTSPYNGEAVTIGARVYIPNGNYGTYTSRVSCWDYSTNAICTNFPKNLTGVHYLYTVNADPYRPTCLWLNSDGGTSQIQNFDAFTGGACGQGATRVLSSALIVPEPQCAPAEYGKLTVTSPARADYTSGTVVVNTGGGNPAGIPTLTIDDNGQVDLSGLDLQTLAGGLPQFVITLVGASATQISVKLEWEADYNATCVKPATSVVDEIAPTIDLRSPEQDQEFEKDEVVLADYDCADEAGASGVQSCVGTVASGQPIDTSTGGIKSFTVTAKDNAGHETTETITYKVLGEENVAPVVTIDGAAERTYGEGETERIFDYTATDANVADTLTVVTSCGAAGEEVSDDGATLKCLFEDGDATSTVSITATDGVAAVVEDTVAVTVSNLAPTITEIAAPAGELVAKTPYAFSVVATDPSPVDQASLEFGVDWDDELTDAGAGPFEHAWAIPGEYLVTATATDKDGGQSAVESHDVFVGGTVDGYVEGFGRTFMVGGTTGGDSFNVKRVGTGVVITVLGQAPKTYTIPSTVEVLLFGGGGDDTFLVESTVLQQVSVMGGTGNDTIDVRSPNSVGVGGPGDDKVLGNDFGRDLLFGGDGLDTLDGKAGEDLLVAGRVPWERANLKARKALESVQLEWLRSTVAYRSRVAHLEGTSSGALNTVFLKAADPGRTVFDDIAIDSLTGGTGNDWIVANRIAPGTLDTVVGTAEASTDITP